MLSGSTTPRSQQRSARAPRTPRTPRSSRYRLGTIAPDNITDFNSAHSAWSNDKIESGSDSDGSYEHSRSVSIGGAIFKKHRKRRHSIKKKFGIIQDAKISQGKKGPLILAPDSLFVTIWLSILTIFISYIMLSLPFNAAFRRDSGNHELSYAVLDVFFMLDIIRKFRTAFMDEGQLVRDSVRIRQSYLRGYFAIDFFCAIPMDILRLWLPHASILIGANKLLGFFQIVFLINDLEKSRDANPIMIRLLKLLIYTIMVSHYVACGWFWFSSYQGFGYDNWVPSADLEYASMKTQYLYSMYFAIGLMFNESNIAIPDTSFGSIFTLVVSLVSVLLLSYMIGSLQTLFYSADNSAADNERRWHYCQKFLRKYKISSNVQIKVRRYYEFIRSKQMGIMNHELLVKLPLQIRCNITMSVLKDMLDNVHWFKQLSPAAARAVLSGLRQRFTIAEEVIYQQSSNSYNLYLIKTGGVALLFRDKYNRVTRIGVLGTGAVFGESAALQTTPYMSSAITLSACEIYELSRSRLLEIARLYPQDFAIMLEEFNSHCVIISAQIERIKTETIASRNQQLSRSNWAKIRSTVAMMATRHQGIGYYIWKVRYFLLFVTINPMHPYWIRWQNVVMLIVNFNLFRFPLMILSNWNFTAVTSIFIFNYVFDTILIIDVLLRFRLWTLKRTGASETDPRQLERSYLKSNDFLVLLLASIPFNWIEQNLYWTYTNKLLRFPQLYMLLRYQLSFYLQRSLARLITLFVYFIMLTHIVSCSYLMFDRLEATDMPNNFLIPKRITDSDPLFSRYCRAALFSFKMLLRLGPSIQPETDAELLLVLVCTIVGVFVTAFFIGHVSAIIAEIDLNSSMFHNRVRRLESLLDRCNVSNELKTESFRYVQHEWQSTDGIDHDHVLEDIPQSLRQDIMMQICGKLLSKAPLFEMMSKSFLHEVVGYLRFFCVPAGQFVFQEGDTAQNMFFILKGRVGLIFPGQLTPVKYLAEGVCFGEMAMLTNALRTASIVVVDAVLLLSLSKDDFNRIFEDHPEFFKSVKNVIEQRMSVHIKQDEERKKRESVSSEII